MELKRQVLDIISPGNVVRIYFGQERKKTELLHVRAIVDDEYVIVRVWSPRRRDWRYRVEHLGYFEMVHEDGRLKLVKSSSTAKPVEPSDFNPGLHHHQTAYSD